MQFINHIPVQIQASIVKSFLSCKAINASAIRSISESCSTLSTVNLTTMRSIQSFLTAFLLQPFYA